VKALLQESMQQRKPGSMDRATKIYFSAWVDLRLSSGSQDEKILLK
jgi:acyl-CoA-binding protein